MMNYKDKRVLITGAGNGMGRELSLLLVKEGAMVIGVDKRADLLSETQDLCGDKKNKFQSEVVDISDKEAVFRLAEQWKAKGGIDVLINNAGIIQPFVKIDDLDFDAIHRVMNINFYGTLHMVKAFLPQLKNKTEAQIVNVSSMGGFLPVPGQSIYGASKAAVKLFTEALYAELLNSNVRVSVVFPGGVGTNITANSGVEMPKMDTAKNAEYKTLSPQKAAELILNGMRKERLYIHVGSDSTFMQKLYRLHPAYATRFIAKKMKDLLK